MAKAMEFICGNRDGRGGDNNATYNVCRLGVTEEDLQKELASGLHPRFLTLDSKWLKCPATKETWSASDAVEPVELLEAGLAPDPGQRLDVVRKMSGNGDYVVCRLGVPRARMVEEVAAGLHPGYRTITVGDCKFVQAKPDKTKENNVNRVGRSWPDGTNCPISRLTAC